VGIPGFRQRLQKGPLTKCGSPVTSSSVWARKYGVDIEFHCKPLGDTDWNGSGMHANFSTTYLREKGGKDYFLSLMSAFEKNPRRSYCRLRSGQIICV